MTNKLKTKSPCELNPNCSSSDAYSEYIDNGVKKGKCFSCGWHKVFGDAGELISSYDYKEHIEYTPLPYNAKEVDAAHNFYPLFSINTLDRYKIQVKADQYNDRYIYLPCYLDGVFRGYQIKQLNRFPKYLSFVNDSLIYYTKQKTAHCETLVITEDWLSAIACSSLTDIEGLAIASNSFTLNSELYKFIDKLRPDKIFIWLDDDQAGRFGARKVDRLLSNLYLTKIIYSKKEPKECTMWELATALAEEH